MTHRTKEDLVAHAVVGPDGMVDFLLRREKFRATNKVARLLAAAMQSSFGHCGESRRKGSFTASASKPARKLGSLADRLGSNARANK